MKTMDVTVNLLLKSYEPVVHVSACIINARCAYRFVVVGWDDIAYNYLVGEDGVVYEGRGSAYVSATAYGWNQISIGVAFIGNFMDKRPPAQAVEALCMFLDTLVDDGNDEHSDSVWYRGL